MDSKILTAQEIFDQGMKIGKLSANRHISDKVVATKKKSLLKCGQAIPAVIVKATTAIDQGLEVLDFESGQVITKDLAAKYVVLTDGNHRYQAHLELLSATDSGYTGEFFFMFPLNESQTVAELLSEINTCTKPWSGADYVAGAVSTMKTELPMLKFIHSLTAKGYSLPSASEYATLSGKLSAREMTKIMNGKACEKLTNDVNLQAGMEINEAAAATLGDEFLRTRTVIDWVIAKRSETTNDSLVVVNKKMCEFFRQLSAPQVKELKEIKGKSGEETKESRINKMLTEFYNDFIAGATKIQA